MPNNERSERDLYAAALGPGKDCPSIEQLASLLSTEQESAPSGLRAHVRSCAYCRTELHLLRTFEEPDSEDLMSPDVQRIARQLQKNSPVVRERRNVWAAFFGLQRLSQAALVAAGLLIAIGLTVQLRHIARPEIGSVPKQEVFRSGSIDILSPVGDVGQAPTQIQWEPVANATRYEVQLQEVDGTTIWKTETARSSVSLPSPIRAQVVPHKTLLLDVRAFNAAGAMVANSSQVRFRFLQTFHSK